MGDYKERKSVRWREIPLDASTWWETQVNESQQTVSVYVIII